MKGNLTRPTSDRVKESLFNIIAEKVPGAAVLDLFAGTGNLGIEALSRGASSAVFVDKRRECGCIIKENLMHTGLSDRGLVYVEDVASYLGRACRERHKYDIIFLDPPYNKNFVNETLKIIENNDIINLNGIIAAESDADDAISEEAGNLKLVRKQKYGDTVLSFYIRKGDTPAE